MAPQAAGRTPVSWLPAQRLQAVAHKQIDNLNRWIQQSSAAGGSSTGLQLNHRSAWSPAVLHASHPTHNALLQTGMVEPTMLKAQSMPTIPAAGCLSAGCFQCPWMAGRQAGRVGWVGLGGRQQMGGQQPARCRSGQRSRAALCGSRAELAWGYPQRSKVCERRPSRRQAARQLRIIEVPAILRSPRIPPLGRHIRHPSTCSTQREPGQPLGRPEAAVPGPCSGRHQVATTLRHSSQSSCWGVALAHAQS